MNAPSDQGSTALEGVLSAAGWREWVGLPELGIPWIKAKLDTGARSSALDASILEVSERHGVEWVRFAVGPWQRSDLDTVTAELRVADRRTVRSSTGHAEERIVVRTRIRVGERLLDADLTLTERSDMGFRMLIGREAMRGNLVVDPGRSYLGGRPTKAVRSRNRGRVS